MNIQELTAKLVEEDLIDPQDSVPEILTPWYLHVLGVAGAWFATLLLMIFWGFTITDHASGWTVVGLIQAGFALFLLRLGKSELLLHPSLSLWLTGSLMASVGLAGIGSAFDPNSAMLVLIVLSFAYPNALGRLLTLLGAGGCLCLTVADGNRYGNNCDVAMLTLAFAGGLLFLMQEKIWRKSSYAGRLVRPLGLAAFLTLMQLLVFCQWNFYGTKSQLTTSIVFVCAVLWLGARLVHKLGAGLAGSFWALGAILAAGAVTIHSPGIIIGIGILLVGFTAHDRVLQVLAVAYLGVFMSGFYYYLDIMLLDKSVTLLGLGAIFLLLRRALLRRPA